MEPTTEELKELAKQTLTEEDVAKVLITDKIRKQYKIMKALVSNPRATLQQIKKETGIPSATIHDLLRDIKKRFEMRMVFIPKNNQRLNKKL
ncbi:unnamed protein product [marine sediment metagenome]|uniref:HTH iclR-type domain-containing protein n=1 Tax=marine sediment metagenome TaxID=412755 RepID=X0VKW1_9ZZZZ